MTQQQDGEAAGEAQQITVIHRAPRCDVQQTSNSKQVPPVPWEVVVFIGPWFGQLQVQPSEPHRAHRHGEW